MNKKQMLEILEQYEFDISEVYPYTQETPKKNLRIKDYFEYFVSHYKWECKELTELKEKSFDKEAVEIFVEAIKENRSYVPAPRELIDNIRKILKHYGYEYSGHLDFIVFDKEWKNLKKIKHQVSMTHYPEYRLAHTKKTPEQKELEKKQILKELQSLYEQAILTGCKMQVRSHQGEYFTFTPDEIKKEWENGKFIWDPRDWKLIAQN